MSFDSKAGFQDPLHQACLFYHFNLAEQEENNNPLP